MRRKQLKDLRSNMILTGIILAVLMGSTQMAFAATPHTDCIRDATEKYTGNMCTSNDVRIGNYTLIAGPTTCQIGQVITVTLKAEVESGPDRYDIGIWVDEGGGDALSAGNVCYRDFLNPVSMTNLDVDLAGGFGPYFNGEVFETPIDYCGDVPSQSAWTVESDKGPCSEGGGTCVFTYYTFTTDITCVDKDNDNVADLGTCTSWENNVDTQCTDEMDTNPSTSSKCNCGQVPIIGLEIPYNGTITINKVLIPSDDTGLFNLQIDGINEATDVGDGGTTGPVVVDAGNNTVPGASHTVGETAGTFTALADYNTDIYCESNQSHRASATDSGPLEFTVMPNENWVCTITNELKNGTLTLIKTVINNSGGTATADDFQAYINGDMVNWSTTYELRADTYTASENIVTGYTASDWTGDCSAGGTVTVEAGVDKTCTITNDDDTAHLELVKVVVNNSGGTAVTTDWMLNATGPTPIGGAGGVESDVDAGTYKLSETGPAGYTASAWSCTGGSQSGDNITLALGESATCTITNDDIPSTARITPTGTTCEDYRDYRDDPAYNLDTVQYSIKKNNGDYIHQINPGVFFYYDLVVSPSSGVFEIEVTQSNNGSWPHIPDNHEQVILYDYDTCTRVQSAEVVCDHANGTVTITVPENAYTTESDYIFSIKYDSDEKYDPDGPHGLIGYGPITGWPTVLYKFATSPTSYDTVQYVRKK